MAGRAEAPTRRERLVLFSTTLDEQIPLDHSVRLLVEILDSVSWAEWERHYCLVEGQPPIHPKIVAGALLYGLSLGIRSSRRLEYMWGHSIDFMWLTENRVIDHSTFCDFRARFEPELKDLFRRMNLIAMRMGLIRLNQVALDGTRVKANSSRHKTASAKTLEQRLAELDAQIEEMFAQIKQNDQVDLFGDCCSTTSLPRNLSNMQRRQESLHKALKAAHEVDGKRRKRTDAPKKAAKVPVADADATILPNKEGGHAPNFNPVAAVDGHRGFIAGSGSSCSSPTPPTRPPNSWTISSTSWSTTPVWPRTTPRPASAAVVIPAPRAGGPTRSSPPTASRCPPRVSARTSAAAVTSRPGRT
ncbi:MAG: transposase [Phycisphaerales bacterium]|nr:MAG: transposase [Phycisphaerales bacterium]